CGDPGSRRGPEYPSDLSSDWQVPERWPGELASGHCPGTGPIRARGLASGLSVLGGPPREARGARICAYLRHVLVQVAGSQVPIRGDAYATNRGVLWLDLDTLCSGRQLG